MTEKCCPHCGRSLVKARSPADHARFFAVIDAAFRQWPESHDFQPTDKDHLRAYLTCKAGYREATPIMLPDDATGHMRELFRLGIEGAVQAAGGYAFVVPYRDSAAVIRPKSIAWAKLGQGEFGAVRSAIEDVISAEIGVTADALLKGAREAA